MHIIEKLQDVRRFWRIFGVVQFFTLAGGAQVSWTQIERSCWQIVTAEIATETSKIEGLPIDMLRFLDFLHLFFEKPPKIDYAAERERRFCKIVHWQRQNKDRNFQWHRWALKNYLWLFQVGNFCVLLSKRSTKWCTVRVMFTRVYWEEPWGFTWHACVHRLI